MIADTLITRLRNAGLTVHDIRAQLPRNGTWMTRPVSAIKGISYHWDAEYRPHAYDSVARYIGQAQYHINKDWGGGAHGDGLMYAMKVDNVGDVFITRNLEEVLWSIGQLNYQYMAVCFDGLNQEPTREQIETMQKLSEVLCYQMPEFPASQGDLLGHQEVPYNSTQCDGTFLPATQQYRNERNTHPERYSWDYAPDAPAPNPTPTPAPAPTPSEPEWKRNLHQYAGDRKMVTINPTNLYDLSQSPATITSTHYVEGQAFDQMLAETSVAGEAYILTRYSFERGLARGIPAKHLRDQVAPTPTPQPTPTPTPVPTPVPTPTPTPDPHEAEQDKQIGWLMLVMGGLLDLLKNIGQSIIDFVTKQKR